MFAEERRQHILKLLRQKKRVDVAALAELLGISPETIRRDLNEMEAGGFLKRTHGGAIYQGEHHSRPLIPLLTRKSLNYEKKAAIARKAAEYVADGDVIALDNSSTTLCMLEFIPRTHKLTLITNSVPALLEVLGMKECNWTCVSLGGVVRPGNNSTYGFLACNTLSFFQPGKLFMSCAGIDPAGNLTEGDLAETEVKRAMIQCSQQTFLLADDTKWEQVGTVIEGDLGQMNRLITSPDVDPARLDAARNMGVEIIFAADA